MLNQQWGLAVWTLITFGASVFILVKFAFGPLQRIIDERRDRIQQSMDAAEETRAEAQRLLDEYRETLTQVRAEAQEILERSRAAGDKAREDLTTEARKQAERIVGDAHRQIERDTNAALRELRTHIAELTALAAGKVAERSFDAADQRRLIDEALAELEVDQLGVEGKT
jgi:F-type H+-transporting ATPase subunit b